MVKLNKHQVLLGVALVAIIVTGVLVMLNSGSSKLLSFLPFNMMSAQSVAKNSVDYLNANVLKNGQTASLVNYSEESGVIKIKITIDSKEYDSYVTRDGKLLFPESIALNGQVPASPSAQTPAATASVTPDNVKKVASTSLDAYVVSDCPFGLQVQRALAEAIKTTPLLAQYVNVRYIGAVSGNTITSMHGDEEAKENLRQICIRDEQKSKYWDYVSCYMQKTAGTMPNGMPYGDTAACQATAKVDTKKLNACVADTTRGLAYAKEDFALNTKYNVQGSPTLVLNGQVISETPFGGRSADAFRNIICSSSSSEPSFCGTKLNTTPATTSFSLTYAATGTVAASSAANCAPAAN
jgi:hypothetical protein